MALEFLLQFPFEAPAKTLAWSETLVLTSGFSVVRARMFVVPRGFVFPLSFPVEFVAPALGVRARTVGVVGLTRARTLVLSDAWRLTPNLGMTTYLEQVYGTGPTFVDADGNRFVLLGSFALDDETLETRRPVFAPPGRIGALPTGRRLAAVRRVRLTGMVEGLLPEVVGSLARLYRSFLGGRVPLRLFRREDADRYLIVRPVRAREDSHRGRFAGRVVTLEFELVADDPFWYAATPVVVTRSVSAGYDQWTVTNPGGVPYQQCRITFTARANGVINPSLRMSQGGYMAQFVGVLNAGESVVLDGVARTATKTPGNVNVLGSMNAGWRADGFPLQPGNQYLTYQDDPSSSHACDVTVEWSPAWW